MKRTSILISFFFLAACSKSVDTLSTLTPQASNPVVTTQTQTTGQYTATSITISGFSLPNLTPGQIQIAIDGAVSGTVPYIKDGQENLIVAGTLFFNDPLIPAIHLVKSGGSWQYEASYPEGTMGVARNYECMDTSNGTWAFSDQGLEPKSGSMPFGDIMVAKSSGSKLSWTKISNTKSFYHSISTGDLDGNGYKDIIGLHMGTKGTWYDPLHPYMQLSDGTFTENRDLFSATYTKWQSGKGAGAVLVKDVTGDGRPEIIRADYGFNPQFQKASDRYSIAVLGWDATQKKYDLVSTSGAIGEFANPDRGATSIKSADFNRDGNQDLAIATEGNNFNGIEIWLGDGKGNFAPGQTLEYTFGQLHFREFLVSDIDADGYPDVLLNPFGGSLFKTTEGVSASNLIWKNSGGTFGAYNKRIVIPGINPTFMKAAFLNGKVRFIGLHGNQDGSIGIDDVQID